MYLYIELLTRKYGVILKHQIKNAIGIIHVCIEMDTNTCILKHVDGNVNSWII